MPSIQTKPIMLTAHPLTPSDAVRALAVQVRAEEPDALVFEYSLDADMSRVRIPPSGAGMRADGLWKHTCFEAFLAAADTSSYHEFNYSPARDWAFYRFSSYREGMSPVEIGPPPQVSVHRRVAGLELEATVRLGALADLRAAPRLKVGLAAVIEEESGRLSYWALRHATDKPDFHHPSTFALDIARA